MNGRINNYIQMNVKIQVLFTIKKSNMHITIFILIYFMKILKECMLSMFLSCEATPNQSVFSD